MANEYEMAMVHIAYEYRVLNIAYSLALGATETSSFVVAFDSFLLHYRSLAEFFHSTKDWQRRYRDDLRAEDYVGDWHTPNLPMWVKWGPSMHILLAHLSLKRLAIHDKKTGLDHLRDFPPMLQEMSAAWEVFRNALAGTAYEPHLENR